ncbi:MAG: uL15 family ribosomal protein [Patescibacteria group bacterium]
MQINKLKRKHANITRPPVGRGGKRGKTSGRGTKGQKARAGRRLRPAIRDIIKKIPKSRGYQFKSFKGKPAPITLLAIERVFSPGDKVTPLSLIKKGLLKKTREAYPSVKILGNTILSKKLIVSGCLISQKAKAAIEKAGGEVRAL